MTRQEGAARRKAGRHAVVSAVVAAAAMGGGAPAASAAASCAFDATTATVNVTIGGSVTTRVAKTPSGAIGVNSAACGAATASNTDTIRIAGDSGNQFVRLALATRLAPGKTSEGSTAASEIEVVLQLAGGYDELRLDGAPTADRWTFGTGGANLNADSDGDDITWSGLDEVWLASRAGDDTLSLAGSPATGAPLRKTSNLLAGQGADVVTGGLWNDYISGDADEEGATPATGGDDRLAGGDGADALRGGPGNDTASGDEQGDALCGGAGDDRLSGGEGADSFEDGQWQVECAAPAADGADVYAGGAGADKLSYGARTDAIRFAPGTVANDGAAGEGDNVGRDVESATGGSADDVLDAAAIDAPHVLSGGGGADTLLGGASTDKLTGGAGDDSLKGAAGDDELTAGDGADTLRGGSGGDSLVGGAGPDSEYGEAGVDQFSADLENDGRDLISGGADMDYVTYYRSVPTRVTLDNLANDGEDAAGDGVAEEGDNVKVDVESVKTGSGDDFISADTRTANAISAFNYLVGGFGDDRIEGGAGEDTIDGGHTEWYGDDGDNTLVGGSGEDQLWGGSGADTFLAKDGEFDHMNGGWDDQTDDFVDADPFDSVENVP